MHLFLVKKKIFYFSVFIIVFNATFSNISVTSWRSVLLVEETGIPGENHLPAASHRETFSHNVVSNTPSPWAGFELTTLVAIGIDGIGSGKSNYHTITTMTAFLSTLKRTLTQIWMILKQTRILCNFSFYARNMCQFSINSIGGTIVSVLASSAEVHGFVTRWSQTNDYKNHVCWFSAKHAALRGKNKDLRALHYNTDVHESNLLDC